MMLSQSLTNILMMFYNFIYYNQSTQKVRCKTTNKDNPDPEFEFVGKMTKTEFDLLIEVLFEQHGDNYISLDQFVDVYLQIRDFSDELKKLINEHKDF